jgi:hypothetical protein
MVDLHKIESARFPVEIFPRDKNGCDDKED